MRRHRHDLRYASDQRFQAYSLLQHVLQQQFWFSHENHHTKICRSADNNIKETVMNLFKRIKDAVVNLFAKHLFAEYKVAAMSVVDLHKVRKGRLAFTIERGEGVPDFLVDHVFGLSPVVEPIFLTWLDNCIVLAELQSIELLHCIIFATFDRRRQLVCLRSAYVYDAEPRRRELVSRLRFHYKFSLRALASVAIRAAGLFEGPVWPLRTAR